jgi:DNA-binding Lrp family transcriptional regulator
MTELELHLLNDFQRGFPLVSTPFATMAQALDVSERRVIESLQQLKECGTVSRVGAVFRPHAIGASTLAAVAVPETELERVAGIINARPEVNHNYEREHRYNLWFVATAPDESRLREVLREIEREVGYPLLILPLLEDYHIDLGFDLLGGHASPRLPVAGAQSGRSCTGRGRGAAAGPSVPHPLEGAVIAAIQQGLPLVSRPFAAIGEQIGAGEAEVITCLEQLLAQGVIRRLGVVVRHHELGYRANAMVVWDVPDDQVSALGRCLGQFEFVTLCYRRPRRLPEWRYNLFCMIHGRDRDTVLGLVEQLRERCGLQHIPYEVLFSRRRFKQCGARYMETGAPDEGRKRTDRSRWMPELKGRAA